MAAKHKLNVLTIENKIKIINRVVGGNESVKKIIQEFKIGEQTVRNIIKRRTEIVDYALYRYIGKKEN